MPIEVKQLIVKGNVDREQESEKRKEPPVADSGAGAEEILDACRRMLEEAMRQGRER